MSEEKTQDKTLNNNETTSNESIQTLFTPEEIGDTVKEFINAYIRGQITLHLYTPQLSGSAMNFAILPQKEQEQLTTALMMRERIKDLILIVAGIKKSTKEQYKIAVSSLFEQILIQRLTNGIEGQFTIVDVEGKLFSLEQKYEKLSKSVQSIDRLVKQILDYVERIDPFKGNQ